MARKRTNGRRPRTFGRAAIVPAPAQARNSASRFSDRKFVAGLIAVGRDNFGQSRPWKVSDPALARSCRTAACATRIGILFVTGQAFEAIGLWIERAEQTI